jgi:archaellum biogenesis protein FlaJ (TadC family)
MATETDRSRSRSGPNGGRAALDRSLYALFSRHADRPRHETDRRRYREAALSVGFDRYLARVYGVSWLVGLLSGVAVAGLALALPPDVTASVARFAHDGLPVLNRVDLPSVPRRSVAAVTGLLAFAAAKHLVVRAGGRYLAWRASARRAGIERSLPGAVRYCRALATGSDDRRAMLRKVAERDAYGETAVAFRRVLNTTALTGSLNEGLRRTARDTPSRGVLSPFLLKFREHGSRGSDALESYLQMESRMLSHRQERERQRAGDFIELLAELFVVLLVLPALLVVIVTVLSVLAPGLGRPIPTPLGTTTARALLVYASAGFVLAVGAGAALLVEQLRPPGQRSPSYDRPGGLGTLRTAAVDPASAALVCLPLAAGVAALGWWLDYHPANVLVVGYVAYGLPVGLVAVRRARQDDAKDREMRDFVHAVAGHVGLGAPFGEAVEKVATGSDLGPLEADVADLAVNLGLVTGPDDRDVRAAALDRFVDRVGTPLAEQTVGLVTGALDVGADADAAFETLQAEIGRLYHERKALRSAMMVYVAVGWTTALLVVGIVVAVNLHVLDGFAQLSAVAESSRSVAIAPDAVQPERDRFRFYLVTQATMLACGWFAGTASRGRYEALLHSAALALVCYVVFAGAGMV